MSAFTTLIIALLQAAVAKGRGPHIQTVDLSAWWRGDPDLEVESEFYAASMKQ